ncbi:hypothetical protein MBLNU13_g06814t1 [Cladosporium sp. NU13]
MEPPTTFEFPAKRASPLLPLSPERVNRRPASMLSDNHRTSDTGSRAGSPAQSTPTRKANLFADYNPITRTPSPSKEVFGGGVAQSPSLPDIGALRSHGRTNSDVQVLVKRFEHLDVRDRDAESEARRKKQEMELRRAQLGREEAESELKKWREECRRIAEDLKESRHRESKVANRLEKVMDDFRQAKGEYSSNAEAYVKEVRKARKEAFKSASVVLKLQETLRDTQKRLQVSKIDHATDVQKADRFEQEATDAKCALMAMQQDMNKLQEQFKVLEQEKEALKTSLKEEEVARIAAEGQIALPTSQEDDTDLFSSPRKSTSPRKVQSSSFSDDKENVGVVTKKMVDTKRLQEEVDAERQKREAAEEMVEFLRMECAFQCCECTSTTRHGRAMRVSMDEILASSIQKMKSDIAKILTPPASEKDEDEVDAEMPNAEAETVQTAISNPSDETPLETKDEIMGEDPQNIPLPEADHSMTMVADESQDTVQKEVEQAEDQAVYDEPADEKVTDEHGTIAAGEDDIQNDHHQHEVSHSVITVPLKDSPSTPERNRQQDYDMDQQHQNSIRTITTTTRIPMHFTPVSKPSVLTSWGQENIPLNLDGSANCAVDDPPAALPFDREAALAAIAYRRGRAKSIADGTYTPRKQMFDLQRRDISAPVVGSNNYTPKPRSLSSRSAGKGMRA